MGRSGAIAVLTSGGDAPGMNAAVRAVVKVAASRGVGVAGVEEGYTGLIEGRFRELTTTTADAVMPNPEIDSMAGLGGTVLGSARELRFLEREGRAGAVDQLRAFMGLIVIGGNGSLAGAHALAGECDTPIIGIPASIDHDIGCSGTAIGVDTALNTIIDACDRISDTARAHRRAFVVEVMGRDSGYLAMASAVAAGADAVMFREQGRSDDEIVDAVERVVRDGFRAGRGKRRVLIIKSEGIKLPCTSLVRLVQERIGDDLQGVDVRATVLGHLVRGGNPTFQDRMIAGRLGLAAVEAVVSGASDEMVAWQAIVDGGVSTSDPAVHRFPLDRVLTESDALIDGSSPVTRWRVQMIEKYAGVLGL